MDRETFGLIMQHVEEIEKMLGFGLDRCFEKEWSGQTDFLGSNSISTTVINGTCAFHVASGKGCVLWQMVFNHNCTGRIVPSTCRLYPITWNNGVMHLIDGIEPQCNCLDPGNQTNANLWDTQKEAIEDIFLVKSGSNRDSWNEPPANA